MTHSTSTPALFPFEYHGKKRLQSQDRFWILTDVESFTSSLYPWSTPQQWYRAGALCLDTHHLMIVEFTTDDVRAFARAGIQPAPWTLPHARGLELTRASHGSRRKGRFRETVKRLELDLELMEHGPTLRKYFERQIGLRGNSHQGMWDKHVKAAARENGIEAAALSFADWFSAGDVKAIVGDINVSRVLGQMVDDGHLIRMGKKKGARYTLPSPKVITRVDWAE